MVSKFDIDREMKHLIAAGEMSGCALVVNKNGQEVFRNKWGYANIERQLPVEYDTIYHLASMSKPVTAVAVMTLIEAGSLELDDPISRYLPSYAQGRVLVAPARIEEALEPVPDQPAGAAVQTLPENLETVPAKRCVSIRDLLTHSSGLGMGQASLRLSAERSLVMDRLAERVERWSEIPGEFQPGEGTGYSALMGFDILGQIIEVVSGMDVQSYLRKAIFNPLGIHDITFDLDEDQQRRLARIYETSNGRQSDVTGTIGDLALISARQNSYYSCAGGLCGTLNDYNRFVRMLANEGELEGVRILKAETAHRMHEEGTINHLELFPGAVWGLGMLIVEHPEATQLSVAPGNFGWSGAFGTHFFIHPEKQLNATLMMNRSNIGGADSPIARLMEKLVYGIFG